MTHILFLHGARSRLEAAADWLVSASLKGRRVLVVAPEANDLNQIDRMLWAHPATGFTPHCSADSPLAAETAILLSASTEDCAHDECLLNLSNEVPAGFGRFAQLVEIVSIANDDRAKGRERYKFYRDRGYPLEAHDLSASPT